MDIEALQDRLRAFAVDRDWEQFHTPKNLATALSVESSELLEIFQWLTDEQSRAVMTTPESDHVRQEMADVLIYLLRLADVLDVDLAAAVESKVEDNAVRYPPARGGA
ncbi:nucleotide pyrophosphohydrolase [Ornithinimicrobium tianjinense]|uniref:Nucleotide pyrophosphohydrolase n=1 Tax=Ornithinimicrobium tianjinense TaxID=1195761 RepID=A0A917BEB8_9MICO|nr:nucleotide pyrophosphohydrolase [Ornithinimicrobium tianjinense]GGF39986.1 nucleotide pyrophosphohydrolase [Ornithinimicrobium tianjinense]